MFSSGDSRPLRRPRRWQLLVVASLIPLGPFVVLARTARRGDVDAWDADMLRLLHGYEERVEGSILDRAVNTTLALPGDVGLLALGLLLVWILLVTRRRRDALFFVLAVAVVAALTFPLKETFERADVKYSFPSGHAAICAAVATAAALIAWPTRWRWPSIGIGAVATAAYGVALVYEDWHLPSDVLGGWCLAVTCAGVLRAGFLIAASGANAPQPSR
jgi:membrane-associated phospholipid phosphatase